MKTREPGLVVTLLVLVGLLLFLQFWMSGLVHGGVPGAVKLTGTYVWILAFVALAAKLITWIVRRFRRRIAQGQRNWWFVSTRIMVVVFVCTLFIGIAGLLGFVPGWPIWEARVATAGSVFLLFLLWFRENVLSKYLGGRRGESSIYIENEL